MNVLYSGIRFFAETEESGTVQTDILWYPFFFLVKVNGERQGWKEEVPFHFQEQ